VANISNDRDFQPEIIVHSNGMGPDHQRIGRVLALKNIPWTFNRIDTQTLAHFPGGKENLPVLQVNRSFFVGSLVSMVALEQLKPEPTIFPNGNCGMPLALAWWGDDFFRTITGNPDSELIQKYCALISRQIVDGRHFLQGEQAGLADVQSYAPLCALKESDLNIPILESKSLLRAWYQRVGTLGTAGFQEISITSDDLPVNFSDREVDFPECDAIADRIILNWRNQGTIFLWHSPLSRACL